MQQERDSHVRMAMLDESGIGGEAKEAITLAFQAMDGAARVLDKFICRLGKISLGRNDMEVMWESVAFGGGHFEGEDLLRSRRW